MLGLQISGPPRRTDNTKNPVTPPSPITATADVKSAAEVERLRALLERQPSCLMRIGISGTLLAVNEAALKFLGARTLADVLDTSIVERIVGDDAATIWADF